MVPPQTPRGLRPQRLASQADACGRVFPFRSASLKCGREPTVPPTNAPLPKCGGGVGEKEIESTPDFPGCFCFSAGVFRGLPRSCSPQARFPPQTPRGLRPQTGLRRPLRREFPFRFASLKCGRNPWFPPQTPRGLRPQRLAPAAAAGIPVPLRSTQMW